jgi:four helix bundle protein
LQERFELGSQTRRAAFSVAANIVEGCAREHTRERLQFLNTARASLAEVGYCLHAAHRLGYIGDQDFEARGPGDSTRQCRIGWIHP